MTTAAAVEVTSDRRSRSQGIRPWLSFLGSMRLAVTLLVVLGIASVIGTVLQQNQPYPDYLEKFGPFWFGMFQRLGLFDVYSAAWFLAILGALVVSTSVCLWRRTPTVLAQMGQYREHYQNASLRALRHHREWQIPLGAEDAAAAAGRILRHHGYRLRLRHHGETIMLAGLSGRSNRVGYVALHLAIVVIAIGGLMDGGLGLKYREWRGDLITETRPLPISELAAETRLPPGREAFRGTVTIPEGERASVAFLQLRDGYLVRELPFELRLDAFRVVHYASGEPRAYESDVVLHAGNHEEPLRRTIRVNEPLHYQGYRIFQSGFGDGGSELSLRAWPLLGSDQRPAELDARVFRDQQLLIDGRPHQLEITDLEPVNVQPDGHDENGRTAMRDVGPLFRYQLRDPAGNRLEFETYMRPMVLDGGRYFVSGVRQAGSTDFRYLHIPVDQNDSPARFVALANLLSDDTRREELAGRAVNAVLDGLADGHADPVARLTTHAAELLGALARGGQQAMQQQLIAGEPATAAAPAGLLERIVDRALDLAYRDALAATGDDPERRLTAADDDFLRHGLATIPALERYGTPLFLELSDYRLRQASTLEITRAPGRHVVYAGSLLLTIGIFLSFFVAYRRSWCLVQPRNDGTSRILLASATLRENPGHAEHFRRLEQSFEAHLKPDLGRTSEKN